MSDLPEAHRLRLWTGGSRPIDVIVNRVQEANRLYAAWARLKQARGKPWGGATIERVVRCACGEWAKYPADRCASCQTSAVA